MLVLPGIEWRGQEALSDERQLGLADKCSGRCKRKTAEEERGWTSSITQTREGGTTFAPKKRGDSKPRSRKTLTAPLEHTSPIFRRPKRTFALCTNESVFQRPSRSIFSGSREWMI